MQQRRLRKPQKKKQGGRKRKRSAWRKKREKKRRKKLPLEEVAVAPVQEAEAQQQIKLTMMVAPKKALETAMVAVLEAVTLMALLEVVQAVVQAAAQAVALAAALAAASTEVLVAPEEMALVETLIQTSTTSTKISTSLEEVEVADQAPVEAADQAQVAISMACRQIIARSAISPKTEARIQKLGQ